jgi:hypothetical protein
MPHLLNAAAEIPKPLVFAAGLRATSGDHLGAIDDLPSYLRSSDSEFQDRARTWLASLERKLAQPLINELSLFPFRFLPVPPPQPPYLRPAHCLNGCNIINPLILKTSALGDKNDCAEVYRGNQWKCNRNRQ